MLRNSSLVEHTVVLFIAFQLSLMSSI